MGDLTAAEIAKNIDAITSCADRSALFVREIQDALDGLGTGTTLSTHIDASGSNALEGKLRNQDTNDLDSWLVGQSQVKIYAERLYRNFVNDLWAYARIHLNDIGEDSHHGTLIENFFRYYGIRVPQYFYELVLQSQGKETSLDADVVCADGGMINEYNRHATLTASAGPALTPTNLAASPGSATPNRLQWKCVTTGVSGGDMVVDVGAAYGQSTWSAASAALATFEFTVPNGTSIGNTGHLVAAGTGQAAITIGDETFTNLAATNCAIDMTLDTQIITRNGVDAVAITFTIAGSTAGAGDTLRITGTDAAGKAITDDPSDPTSPTYKTIDVSAGNGTYVTVDEYATITDIDCFGWADGTLAATQPMTTVNTLTLDTNETDAFYVDSTSFQRALIEGSETDNGETVAMVVTITDIPDGETLVVNELHLNIDTGYSIWPMFHELGTITAGGAHAATAGIVEVYPVDDRTLVW